MVEYLTKSRQGHLPSPLQGIARHSLPTVVDIKSCLRQQKSRAIALWPDRPVNGPPRRMRGSQIDPTQDQLLTWPSRQDFAGDLGGRLTRYCESEVRPDRRGEADRSHQPSLEQCRFCQSTPNGVWRMREEAADLDRSGIQLCISYHRCTSSTNPNVVAVTRLPRRGVALSGSLALETRHCWSVRCGIPEIELTCKCADQEPCWGIESAPSPLWIELVHSGHSVEGDAVDVVGSEGAERNLVEAIPCVECPRHRNWSLHGYSRKPISCAAALGAKTAPRLTVSAQAATSTVRFISNCLPQQR